MAIHLSDQPEVIGRAARPLLDLAPSGVYLAAVSPRTLVRSYRTVSPLPVPAALGNSDCSGFRGQPAIGGLLSVALSFRSP
jgi:hypothetical protein